MSPIGQGDCFEQMALMLRTVPAFIVTILSCGAAGNRAPGDDWLHQLRLSSDGKYALAQDGTEITLLSIQPLAVLHIPVTSATLAQFTPDSKQVVFINSIMRVDTHQVALNANPARVEQWSVSEHRRSALAEIPSQGCQTLALSPDGRFVVCVRFDGQLRMVNVNSGSTIFKVKGFSKAFEEFDTNRRDPLPFYFEGDIGTARIEFSTDARYVVAEPQADGKALAFDFSLVRPVELGGALRILRNRPFNYEGPVPFIFLGPEHVVFFRQRNSTPVGRKRL